MTTHARFTASVLLGAGIFLAGYMANRQPAPVASSAAVKQARRYACPMHPQYTSDHAGECPACGMQLDPARAGDLKSVVKGKTYYFCSTLCKARFDRNPEKYIKHTNES
jgi:YHS domain-containing protein